MPIPLREKAPQDKGPELRKAPDLSGEERAAREAEAARAHESTEELRAKTAEYDAAARAKVQAEVDRAKRKPDEATLAIEEAIDAVNNKTSVARVQREVNAATWEGNPHTEDTMPMMEAARTMPMMRAVGPEAASREMAEANGMVAQAEERLTKVGISTEDLALGKVGFFKKIAYGDLIRKWQEAVHARTELEPKARPIRIDRKDAERQVRARQAQQMGREKE